MFPSAPLLKRIGPVDVILIRIATARINGIKNANAKKAPTRSITSLINSVHETSGVDRNTSIGRPPSASKSGLAIEVRIKSAINHAGYSLDFAGANRGFDQAQLAVTGGKYNPGSRVFVHRCDQIGQRLAFDIDPVRDFHQQFLFRRQRQQYDG